MAVLGGSTGTLYQAQCADASNRSAFLAKTTLSMHLWHCRMDISDQPQAVVVPRQKGLKEKKRRERHS